MGFFSGILKKAAPLIGGAIGTLILPGAGTAIGSALGGAVSGMGGGDPQYGTAAGSAIGGQYGGMIGSFLGDNMGNWISSGMDAKSAADQNAENWKRFNAGNEFSAAQAQQNRDFQERMWGASADFNAREAGYSRDFAQSMFNQSADFNSREAGYARDFEERMRATQYQTAIGDMQAAGLNPMLAYSQGGAGNVGGSAASVSGSSGSSASVGTPSGSTAHSLSPAGVVNAAEFAGNMEQRQANIRLTDAQAATARANAELIKEQTKTEPTKQALNGALEYLHNANETNARAMLDNIHENRAYIKAQANLARQNGVIRKADADFINSLGDGSEFGSEGFARLARLLIMILRSGS